MRTFSTTQAARMLGIDPMTFSRYIKAKKVPAPKIFAVGDSSLHAWTEEEVEHLRKLLPKIANGRKTRHKRKPKTQPGAAVLHKQSKPHKRPKPRKAGTTKKK